MLTDTNGAPQSPTCIHVQSQLFPSVMPYLCTCKKLQQKGCCRLWEISRQERARSSRLASSSSSEHEFGTGRGGAKSQQWDAALFGPTGLLPGQSHTPTRIGRDLHELVMDSSPSTDSNPGVRVRSPAAKRSNVYIPADEAESYLYQVCPINS